MCTQTLTLILTSRWKKRKRTLIFYLKETRVGYPLDSYIFTKKHRKVHKNKTNKQKQIAIFRAVWQTPGCHLVLFSLCSQSLSGPSVVPATVILVSKPYQVPSYCSLFEEDYLFLYAAYLQRTRIFKKVYTKEVGQICLLFEILFMKRTCGVGLPRVTKEY